MEPIKRLILCCDGTWNDSISTNNPLTNVARFSRCVEERKDGILQIVYYHTGVGVGTSRISNSIDGAVGRGLGANVRNAYNFICQNYNHKDCNDEIFLVGFSRGAFTVRCVASLVDSIGILTKSGLSQLYKAYSLWKKQHDDESSLKAFVEGLKNKGLVRTGIKIKACGVWDTVSAIGVQLPAWLPQPPTKKLAHVDNRIPLCVENAFHAMALDERRSAFWPLPWSEPHDHVNLRQCWFLGAHADVGGGYEDAGLANVAFIWMVAQFQHFTSLAFDEGYLIDLLVTRVVEVVGKQVGAYLGAHVGYGFKHEEEISRYKGEAGKIANSFTLFWQPFGQRPRKPGTSLLMNKVQYSIGTTGAKDDLGVTTSSPPQNGLNTGIVVDGEQADTDTESTLSVQNSQLPQATCDTIHFTVRVLLAKQYHSCHVLKKFCTVRRSRNSQQICWQQLEDQHKGKGSSSITKTDQHLSIDEAEVTEEEYQLLKSWLDAAAKRGTQYSYRKETSFLLPASSFNVSSPSASFKFKYPADNAECLKAMLDDIKEIALLDLWILLCAHLEESMRPTLMYNSNATESTR